MKTLIRVTPKYYIKQLLLTAIIIFSNNIVNAQTDLKKFQDAIKEDSTLINGLAGFDKPVRQDILTVAQHPEVLTKIKEIKEQSQAAFQKIIQDYDRDTQFGLYELSRYPDLVEELTINGKKSKNEIETILLSYPEDIYDTGIKYGRKRHKELAAIDHLSKKNKKDFEALINNYDDDFNNSIKRLLNSPEILSTMADNIEFTRLTGSVYTQYPEESEEKLEIWHNQLKAKKEAELEDYQKQIKEDPEAYDEMLEAAEQFAAEETATKNINEQVTKEVEVVHVNHYSYWYGYPHWYTYPYWRPYPWYYHTGFYFGTGGSIIFIGMPSYWYVGWHHHHYPNRYPHLTYHYYRHSYRHPHSYYNFNRTVNVNINKNVNINRNNLVRIDNNRNRIMQKQRPAENINRPAARPASRPATRPGSSYRTKPHQYNKKPAKRYGSYQSSRSTYRRSSSTIRYNNYRSNESFRQNWSRPVTRPGGFRRR